MNLEDLSDRYFYSGRYDYWHLRVCPIPRPLLRSLLCIDITECMLFDQEDEGIIFKP